MAGEARVDPQAAFRASIPEQAARHVPDKTTAGATPAPEVERQEGILRDALAANPDQSSAQTVSDTLAAIDKSKPEQAELARSENIGTERNPDGTRVAPATGTPEAVRTTEAESLDNQNAQLIEALNKGSYIDFTKPEFAHIKKGLDELTDADPEATHIPLGNRDHFYRGLLKNEQIRNAIVKLNGERISERIPGEAEVREAQRAAKEARAKYDIAEKGRKRAKGRVRDLKQKQIDSSTVPPSGQYATLDGLRSRDLATEKLDAQNLLKITQNKLTKAQADLAADPTNPALVTARDTAKSTRDKAAGEVKKVEDAAAELRRMESEISSLTQNLREAQQAKATADSEFATAESARDAADQVLSSAVLRRANAETEWINGKRNLVRDAVKKVNGEQRDKAITEGSAKLEEEAKNAASEKDAKMSQARRNKYYRTNPKTGKLEIDYSASKADMATLLDLTQDGARAMLMTEMTAAGYTPNEITEKLKDAQWVREQTANIAESVVFSYSQGGGRLNGVQLSFMEAQPWGQDIINRAFKNNKTVQDADRRLKEAGIKEGLRDKRISGKGLLYIILGIVAGSALALAGVGMAANSGVIPN